MRVCIIAKIILAKSDQDNNVHVQRLSANTCILGDYVRGLRFQTSYDENRYIVNIVVYSQQKHVQPMLF